MKPVDMPPRSSPGLFFGVAGASFLAEIAACLALTEYGSGFLVAAGLHVASLALIGLWVLHAYRRYRDRFGLFLLPLTAAGGPFGAGIALLAAIIYARNASDAISPAEWIGDLFARH